MKRQIEDYVKQCHTCQVAKTKRPIKMPLKITSISDEPFRKLFIDIVEGLPESNKGNKEAETIAKALFEEVFCTYLIPDEMLSDRGPNFCGHVIRHLCKLLNIKKIQTTAYRPSSNPVERVHSDLGNFLRRVVDQNPANWDDYVKPAAYTSNNTVHRGTKFTPSQLPFGKMMRWTTIVIVTLWTAAAMTPPLETPQGPFHITPLYNSASLVEAHGQIAMAYDHWTIVTSFNREGGGDTIRFLVNATSIAEGLCNHRPAVTQKHKFDHNCRATLEAIHALTTRIRIWDTKLSIMMRATRPRRAIEPLGSLWKWLAGSPNAEDGRRFENRILQVERNENITFHLAEEQLTVMSSSLQAMVGHTIVAHRTLETKAKTLSDEVYRLENRVNNTFGLLKWETEINMLLNTMLAKTEEIALIRADELLAMDAVINNIFHHSLLDLSRIGSEYERVASGHDYLPIGGPPLDILKFEHRCDDNRVVVKIIIPLPENKLYDLKKVYPIPLPVNENLSKIVHLEAQWVATNTQTKTYILWKDPNAACRPIRTHNYTHLRVCEHEGPVHTATHRSCITDQVNGRTDPTNFCTGHLVATPKLWVTRLSQENTWLFTTRKATLAKITCDKDPHTLQTILRGTGTIHITQRCDVELPGLLLRHSLRATPPTRPHAIGRDAGIDLAIPEWTAQLRLTAPTPSPVQEDTLLADNDFNEVIDKAVSETNRLARTYQIETMTRAHQTHDAIMARNTWSIWSIIGVTAVTLFIGLIALVVAIKYRKITTSLTSEIARAILGPPQRATTTAIREEPHHEHRAQPIVIPPFRQHELRTFDPSTAAASA
ncbi:Retrovirus-related Pol polyprotein [Pseudolycoriella hygida]|uniref:Retrovirus-related Pol polyprotein n=1 Tax=Pseudolycoriella hygida TaxID=35572 RepID=A0A9Q0N4N8_9DIPT|nr:Retrovirus-related Pol polyprotein [Pseudolycoriella hygida]